MFPTLYRATLDNGLKIVLAERHDVPVVQMSLQLNGGFASDPAGKEGLASFATGMLNEGAGDYDTVAFNNRAERLGANLGASAGLDGAAASLSALKETSATRSPCSPTCCSVRVSTPPKSSACARSAWPACSRKKRGRRCSVSACCPA